jgi:hypothetical protein
LISERDEKEYLEKNLKVVEIEKFSFWTNYIFCEALGNNILVSFLRNSIN